MGCNKIFLSNFCSINILKINIIKMQKSKGSVGIYILKSKPGIISLNGIEKGVIKTKSSNNLSREKKANNKTKIPIGNNVK